MKKEIKEIIKLIQKDVRRKTKKYIGQPNTIENRNKIIKEVKNLF